MWKKLDAGFLDCIHKEEFEDQIFYLCFHLHELETI